MKCPHCFDAKNRVTETRSLANTIWRVRRCEGCGQTWATQESKAEKLPKGIHKNARGTGTKARSLFKPMKPKNLPAMLFQPIKESA